MNLFNIKKEEFSSLFKEQKSHWNLFIWIFLYSLIPACWILVRAIVITRYMSASVETYAQWDYLNIMLEVIQETIVLPLFWWFGSIKIGKKEDLNKIREVYIFTFIIYFILICVLNIFVGDLVKVIGSQQGYEQRVFFSLQLWSKIPSILTGISTVILLNLKNYKGFLALLIVKLLISIIFDFTLANNNVFDNAYIGLGLSTLLTEICLFVTSIIMLAYIFGFKNFFNLKTFSFNIKKWNFNKVFFSNVLASFLFSTINNTFYLFMMAKNMNIAKESDAYWLSNTVIWSWILMIPNVIFSINKSIVSTQNQLNFKKRVMLIFEFQLISLLSILLSFAIFIPVYKQFTMFLSDNNVDLVNRSWTIFSKLIWFFIFYVSASTFSAHFNGEGKNWLITAQALICNILTFVPFIIINSIGALQYTVDVLALMFGFSLMVSWIIGIIFIVGFLYIENLKEKKKITI
ncbi:hypothetical protein [Spiroplasma floricola]|uniref:MATE efflux family protein n=1 Tax=Spiroplasma floricola 23-6 TaxID=1336749 RepID=A0A2K8SED7_9MOLU|nr:hypothetical protein [Spiroplasma floricola]AUB31773.1 hypothetical protein SFLOR_v1c07250 [Spiroplasma floricola 23-6]